MIIARGTVKEMPTPETPVYITIDKQFNELKQDAINSKLILTGVGMDFILNPTAITADMIWYSSCHLERTIYSAAVNDDNTVMLACAEFVVKE